ncbi:MAG: tRNA (adenosine(37)-N6)-dimethylallyltransferase MiaA [Defluviitaleaceae bacterium]|nr:tRNA (adenosine(37)-N6)-dimethylallyltransferase MiaA [Defluviitaleaceae bacterium]
MDKIIIIGGPTATGKSGTAVALAKLIFGEIISADSMQIYHGMDIGTAKILHKEMEGVPHHLIDQISPDQPYNVAIFKAAAKELIGQIISRGATPIICGGTGFYINALLYDVDFDQKADPNPEYRKKLQMMNADQLFTILEQHDPCSAQVLDKNNIKRVMRALEFYHVTGQRISDHNQNQRSRPSAYDAHIFILNNHRDRLYSRINKRVDDMVEKGLVEEVRFLLDRYDPALVSMQGLGYKEIVPYLQGETDLEAAVNAIKQGTRRFAKRQITWFKHQLPSAIWLDVDNYQNFGHIAEEIKKRIEKC